MYALPSGVQAASMLSVYSLLETPSCTADGAIALGNAPLFGASFELAVVVTPESDGVIMERTTKDGQFLFIVFVDSTLGQILLL